MRAMIVDDEPNSHKVLKALLEAGHPQVQLAGSAYNVQDGLALVRSQAPDLLFLDVEMPDGTGFDLLAQWPARHCRVIFITAHEHYARRAIRFGAIDFLTKPITAEELAAALDRVAQDQAEQATREDQIRSALEAQRRFERNELPSRFAVRDREAFHYRKVEELIRLEASANYTELHFSSEPPKLVASVNLGEYEEQFRDYPYLMRVQRSHLVNLHCVSKFVTQDGGYLVLEDGTSVPVSKRYRDELIRRMEQL